MDTTLFPVEGRQAAALSDPVFMLKLYKRVAYGLVPRLDPSGPRCFLHSFLSVDGRCVASRDAPMDPDAVAAAVAPVFPPAAFSRTDVALLLHVLPLADRTPAEACGVRLGEVTLALRELVPFHAWQITETVAAVRAAVEQSPVMSPLEEHVTDMVDYERSRRRQASEPPPPPLLLREALFFFERVCGLSVSQSQLFLNFVKTDDAASEEEGEEGTANGGAAAVAAELHVDVRLVHQLLFSEEIPGVAEYPLLMGRFAEATVDSGEPEVRPTGSLALQSSLAAMELSFPASARTTPLDLDFGALVRAELSPRQFFYLCKSLRVGFEQRESDQLFYYLKRDREDGGGVLVSELVAAYRQYFPAVTMSMLQLVHAATAALIRRGATDSLAFVRLYASLREWGAARIPIAAFVKAFRAAGVPDGLGGVLSVELEWLRLKAPTRVDLLLMLTTPIPSSRTAVIQKLFERLGSGDRTGCVACAAYLDRFQPDRIEGATLRRQVVPWKAALQAYVEELKVEALDYDVFAYFWYMVSAGVEDDPTFTVAVWQGFGLADGGRRMQRR